MLKSFKEEGIAGGVFGDIDLAEHRHWIERVCSDVGVTPYLPLWGKQQMEIMEEFIDLGFNAIVVAARAEIFGREWLGRRVDREFIRYVESLSRSREVTPCGEAGEYHTLVVDGPIFRKRLDVIRSRRIQRDGRWFLSVLEAVPVGKGA